MARLGLRTESEPIILRIRLGPCCGRKASERALTATMVTALPGEEVPGEPGFVFDENCAAVPTEPAPPADPPTEGEGGESDDTDT